MGNHQPKGVRYGGRAKGTPNKRTVWLLESLNEHGFDYEVKLAELMEKAMRGDRHALDMLHLLVKMAPYVANAPKTEHVAVEIDKLVINRFESRPAQPVIDTTAQYEQTNRQSESIEGPQPH